MAKETAIPKKTAAPRRPREGGHQRPRRSDATAAALAIGMGNGSEMRRPLGIAIVGGLILSQLLTLYTTPVVYLYLDRFCSGLGDET